MYVSICGEIIALIRTHFEGLSEPEVFLSGSGEIRTLETLSSLPSFQDGALDPYATLPFVIYNTELL